MAPLDQVTESVPAPTAKGKGKGKGKGPALPTGMSVAKSPPKMTSPGLQIKVRTSEGPLSSTPFTVVTRLDGSRWMERPDGSVQKLHKNGGPLGLDDPKAEPIPEKLPKLEDCPRLRTLVEHEPRLVEFMNLLEGGVPLKVLQARMRGELGHGLSDSFMEAIDCPNGEVKLPELPAELQGSHQEKHGRQGNPSWAPPMLAAQCSALARPGYNSGAAHEYVDVAEVLHEKVKLLAALVRRSTKFVIYAGAGLSTASGIVDYATKTGIKGVLGQINTGREKPLSAPISPYCARPNLGHLAIGSLARAGLVYRFVQQNHDGLPQKAGVPQHIMNGIHGGWFDPSNPVVNMKGQLRNDLFKDLMHCERCADLVLVLGSSLCGMNSDRLVSTCAHRAQKSHPGHEALGSVIVSLQRTPHDANSSLRIFAKIDDVMSLLMTQLALEIDQTESLIPVVPTAHLPFGVDTDVFSVPYDGQGCLVVGGDEPAPRSLLDLRAGAELLIAVGANKGAKAVVLGKNDDGHYRIGVKLDDDSTGDWSEVRFLGSWWPATAVAGQVDTLPIINRQPFLAEADS